MWKEKLWRGTLRARLEREVLREESVKEYVENHKASGLSIGDEVRIVRKAESKEGGWEDVWVKEMDKFIGKVGRIKDDYGGYGFLVELHDEDTRSFTFPYFCLEKVNK